MSSEWRVVLVLVGIVSFIGLGFLTAMRRKRRGDPPGEFMDEAWEWLTNLLAFFVFVASLTGWMVDADARSSILGFTLGGVMWLSVRMSKLLRKLNAGTVLVLPKQVADKCEKVKTTVFLSKRVLEEAAEASKECCELRPEPKDGEEGSP